MKKEDNADEEVIKTKGKQSKESKPKKKQKPKKEKNKKNLNNSNKKTVNEDTNKTNYAENKEEQKAENSTESNANEQKEEIKFFKKMRYSVAKVSKYDEMANLGFKVSLKYFFGVICIVSILFPIVVAIGTLLSSETEISVGAYLINMLAYYLGNIIILALTYIFFIFIISVCMFFITKIVHIREKLAKWMSLTIYSSTLSVIIYEIFFVLDMIGLSVVGYDLIALIVMYIYLAIIVRKKRGGVPYAFYRRNKKKSKKRNKNNNPA